MKLTSHAMHLVQLITWVEPWTEGMLLFCLRIDPHRPSGFILEAPHHENVSNGKLSPMRMLRAVDESPAKIRGAASQLRLFRYRRMNLFPSSGASPEI